MSKTITEVQQAKKELETKIAKMLLDFESENGVKIEDCNLASYPTMLGNGIAKKIEFSISVSL